MKLWELINSFFGAKELPLHLRHGALGEKEARKFLKKRGFKFLTANFKTAHGEIDLIFRDRDCLVFVEVKTRSSEEWTRPAAAVNAHKQKLLSKSALDYLKLLRNPEVKFRFDITEVLLTNGKVREIRHIENAFVLSQPLRYGA